MDLRRARSQDWLTGALGAVLVVSLFLGWYRPCSAGDCRSAPATSAWEAFAVTDVVLLLAGLLAIAALVLTLAQRTSAVPLAVTSIGTLVALVAAILAVAALIAAPELPGGDADTSAARLLGAWLGLVAALGLVGAMLASVRDERTPLPARSRQEQAAAVRNLSVGSVGQTGGATTRDAPRAT